LQKKTGYCTTTRRTDPNNPHVPFLSTAKKGHQAKTAKKPIYGFVPDSIKTLHICLSIPVPNKETAPNPNAYILREIFVTTAQAEDPTFALLSWTDPHNGPHITCEAVIPNHLNEFQNYTPWITSVSNKRSVT
jgi:hypothetical protein